MSNLIGRLIDIDDERNCYIGMDGEYEQWNIAPDVLAEAQPDPNALEQEYLKGWEDGRKNLLEYISRLLSLPSAQSDWNELMVICDNCGHAIHVKKENQ